MKQRIKFRLKHDLLTAANKRFDAEEMRDHKQIISTRSTANSISLQHVGFPLEFCFRSLADLVAPDDLDPQRFCRHAFSRYLAQRNNSSWRIEFFKA